ncbi:3-hydroxyacyl-CoA dehydrogenase/enoyl-CoA hydratase/3-hydroxybutyryl-CoA epimerase/enoyl-CoA isomerase [Variovorax sp. 54]|uniref:fatty acid oxidation complex subunit alpha FadB n=1 Tax=Variovorax sp. 54 TaxID=2035212 RepID=UPI000C18B4C0|nr:fatty acid oxidation complex subunit alpha FadB [Variovorax sp. 54]PIF75079.1 3-hydroxyacyl-CoA dehydrogenase/enoyl-CoA hydratase/3-hydroxybutyryl-CoA epimerase/enoyl-CoA isomerase [Variovorax sp. 54]
MFQGESIEVLPLQDGLVELRFDRRGEAINKLDARTVDEFRQATERIAASPAVRGVLVTSAKDVFIVGADITEFGATFQQAEADIARGVRASNELFNAFEDLAVPSVVAINGFALGGGLELAMLAPLRVMADTAQVGVPEVKLGLFPGFGGTVRLSRLAGLATAIDWVASGKPAKAPAALAAGVTDEVAAPEALRDRSLALLQRAVRGEVDWQAAQQRKRAPLALSAQEAGALVETARTQVAARSGKHQPAALIALEMMAEAAGRDRAGALDLESAAFGRVAKTQAAASLVQAFLNDQALKKLYKRHAREGRPVKQAAVLGAGIMGGGIAYTSALRGMPVRMKDIAQPQLDLGMAEAGKQLAKQVKNGRLAQEKADAIQASIVPQLDEAGFDTVDCVVEAVVENLEVKRKVLAALEGSVKPGTVIASNTSSLRIDDIAQPLARPEDFVGMHFFNPVPVMQLVEVIQGAKTSNAAVSTAVGYAVAMGKTPIVVKDCPGFLVNRILTPYINAFVQLVADGADFEAVDRAMEAFGWPMGPAYLQDVVGMDVGAHVGDVIAAGYPQRMPALERNAVKLMVANKRYGQKNGAGFYRYENDPTGRPRKSAAPEAHALVATLQPQGRRDFADAEIVERMMLPMVVEAAHALEDGVVATPAELDMALLLGVGFPAYAGGALKYADWLGLDRVVALCDKHAALGAPYVPTARMREMAAQKLRYYPV